jgi:Integrase zinc binding domain
MPPKRTTIASSIVDTSARDHFYRLAREHIDSLNVKFREKAVITRALSEKITNALRNESSHETKAGLFLRWCRQSFLLRPIGGHQVLCDIKNIKPVLLFEDMYEVYQDSHQQTAHSGRDKCQEFISANYSWFDRTLLQIFISQCSACQTRKSIKLHTVTKPIIALGNRICLWTRRAYVRKANGPSTGVRCIACVFFHGRLRTFVHVPRERAQNSLSNRRKTFFLSSRTIEQ